MKPNRKNILPRLILHKFLIVLCCTLATTAVFGTTITWTGTGADISVATNWGGTLPNSANGDICQFNGVPAGNLFLTAGANNGNLNNGTPGVSFLITANQTGALNLSSSVSVSANLALDGVNIASGAGAFSFGNGSANVFNIICRPSSSSSPGPVHNYINNSANTAIIYPNVRWQSGGGNPHQLLFTGTGDWNVTNNLIFANNTGMFINKAGSGTLFWAGPSIAGALGNNAINSPLDFEGGTVVLKNGNPLTTQSITNNGVLLKYDAPAQSQTLSGTIRGTGLLMVNDGTLTLSGSSTFTGNTILTNTGVLILGSAHNPGVSGPIGIGGSILFNGGTLQFSAANTFDYSSRFSGNPNQAYKFDTGGQNVTLTNVLASSGATLTKSGSGTLTLSGTNTYSGSATVTGGKLVFQGGKTGAGDITVANSTALGITDTGTQVTPGTLTLGTSAGVTLEFNNVNSTTTAPLTATTLATGGTVTVNINGGSFAIGQSYPLLTWTTGSPAFTLGTLTGAGGNLSVSGNTLYLNVTSLAFVWTGLTDGNWDISTLNNWKAGGISAIFANGNTALFDDTAAGQTNVTLNAPVTPASVTVNASTKTYSITSSGTNLIGGAGGLTKNGTSTLTLAGGVNTYGGATTVSGGTLTVGALANGGSASDIGSAASGAANLVLNGGTLQYTGGAASVDRLFTIGTAGGSLDASSTGALNLNNSGSVALSGSGARAFILKGTSADDNTLAATLADNGGATSLAKSGAGKWIVSANNNYSGGTTITAGTLQVGAGGASGSLGSGNIADSGSLIFNRSGILTNGVISGTGSVTVDGGGTIVLPGNNSYTGGTTINSGSTLQVGVGGATGSLSSGNPIVNNGLVIFNSTGTFNYSSGGVISGSGNVIVTGAGGLVKAIGANSYTGWTLIDLAATFQPCEGNTGGLVSPVVTNNGTIKMVRQDNATFIYSGQIVGTGKLLEDANNNNAGDVTLTGTNTYTGGTFIANNTLILGDGSTPGAGSIVGDVIFTNSTTANNNARILSFNRPDDFVFAGKITSSTNLLNSFGTRGAVVKNGAGTLTLTANNDYYGGTTINAGTLEVGAGGTSGAIGNGAVTDNSILVFNRADNLTFDGVINGTGSVVKNGAGTLTLTGTNNYFGTMTVSNGTLFVNNEDFAASTEVVAGTFGGSGAFYGPINLAAGTTLAPGASANGVGILTANSTLTIGGNVAVQVNKSLVQSNDLVVGTSVTKTGTGTLTVANVGPALTAGDKFTLFSQSLTGGSGLTVTGAGATWQNNLETDGSITALTVAPTVNTNPPVVQVSVSGSTLSLGWPTNLGWTLQTNSVGLTAANQWFSYPGSASLTNVTITINPAKTNVFFRMVYTNTP